MFREGASVLMTDLNKELLDKALERVREVVSNVPINLETRVVDVSSKSEVEQAVNHLDSWGGLEVILNNAGVMHPRDGDTHECSAEVWNKTFDINVKGVWYGSKHAVKSLRKHGKTKRQRHQHS